MVSMSKLNLQVQKVLILQAIGPFITAAIPMTILSFMVLFNLEQDILLLSVATLFVWVAGFNASAALFIVKAYRKRILRRLCPWKKNYVTSSSSIYFSRTHSKAP
uniref:G_PROTEIN_RECEP_F1_2 domain-containing protein n=1 Tax=Panagrellus redivivus TaxID=6233 RepID=A0A7E4ZSM8_PANRE